jgi:predicted DNA-binding transcriptional regulator AlpA
VTDEHGAILAAILTDPRRIEELEPEDVSVLLAEVAAIQATLAARNAVHQRRAGHLEPRAAAATPDRLLTVDQAAELINVKRQWLYRHHHELPFAQKLSRKALRFSEAGLRRWLALRRALKSHTSAEHSARHPRRASA